MCDCKLHYLGAGGAYTSEAEVARRTQCSDESTSRGRGGGDVGGGGREDENVDKVDGLEGV